jgi:DNA-binding XRE family transcriptional regulator
MAGRRVNKTDVAVGHRIREFRKGSGLSQTALAEQIGVTFQQVQKYEKGVNRVGAGRLTHIARAFGVPITAFFEGLGGRWINARKRALVWPNFGLCRERRSCWHHSRPYRMKSSKCRS